MTSPLLEIHNLRVIYKTDENTVYALNGLNLSLEPGKTLGLVGETGAGKTTTALSILRLLPDRVGKVEEGEIHFMGEAIFEKEEKDMETLRGNQISMIFQDPMTSLNPVFTVGEQIAEVIELHNPRFSKAQVQERVDEMFRTVGLPPERKGEYPHQFSGGMKQRIVIAMALACEPVLLLADEPTTALDVTIQAQVLILMKELKAKFNTAMIMITHDLGIVAQICDEVGIMYAGNIVELGTLEEVFESEKKHPYTTGLFGSIPDLTVKTQRLNPIEGLMPDPTNLPKGCKFHPRCTKCMEICKEAEPDYYIEGTHKIKCHLYHKRPAVPTAKRNN